MVFKLLVIVIMISIDSRLPDRAVHSFNLAVGPWMLYPGQSVLNAVFPANTIKNMLKGKPILFSVGELNPVIRQDSMNGIRQSLL